MQQTKKYKLNLIEKTDAFSPDALNQNMEKVEAALEAAAAHADSGDAGEAAARAQAVAALDQRLQVVEAHKFVCGYTSPGTTEYLGFTPRAVFVQAMSGQALFTENYTPPNTGVRVVEGGFHHEGGYASCAFIAFR